MNHPVFVLSVYMNHSVFVSTYVNESPCIYLDTRTNATMRSLSDEIQTNEHHIRDIRHLSARM